MRQWGLDRYMYISEELIKDFLQNELKENSLWLVNANIAEKKFSINLGSHESMTKRRPFVILKTNKNTDIVCVVFFSSKQFYKNQLSFAISSNCEKKCKFHFFDTSYVYKLNKKEVFSISKNVFDFMFAEYCGTCNNIDYLTAKLKNQVENCK